MKQVLIQKNEQIRELSGSRLEFYKDLSVDDGEPGTSISDREVTKLKIPFKAKILSGGTLDIDFSLPEGVAAQGVTLLGAYWNGDYVTAYMRSIQDLNAYVKNEDPLLVGTLVQVTTMRQIESKMLGGVVNVEGSGSALKIDPAIEKKKPRRGQRK